jgi:hypothetical protein
VNRDTSEMRIERELFHAVPMGFHNHIGPPTALSIAIMPNNANNPSARTYYWGLRWKIYIYPSVQKLSGKAAEITAPPKLRAVL